MPAHWLDGLAGRCGGLPSLASWYVSSLAGGDAPAAAQRARREGLAAWRRPAGAETRLQLADSRQEGSLDVRAGAGRSSVAPPDPTLEQAVLAANPRRAYQLFMELRRLEPDSLPRAELCDKLLLLLARESSFRVCWEVFGLLEGTPLRYSTLVLVMEAAIRADELRAAAQTFRAMQARGLQPNRVTWCRLVSSLARSKRKGRLHHEAAYRLWREMRADASLALEMDAPTYATGMLACTRVGQLQEAEQLLEEMRESGFEPDIRAYNILLRGYCAAGEVGRLPGLMQRIEAAGLAPSATTFNTLIDAYVNAGMLPQAKQTMADAAARGVALDAWAYSSLMKGHVRAQELPEAMLLLAEMDRRGVPPTVVTMTTLLDGCARAGRMQQAEAVLRAMEQRGLRPNVVSYNVVLRGYAAAGDTQAVRDVMERMGVAGLQLREDTFNTLMEGALTSDNPGAVPRLFRQLAELDLRPDSLSYTSLLTALGRLSRPDTAMEVFGQLESEEGVCAIALNALVSVLARNGRMAEAEAQLARAADMAAEAGRPPPVEAFGAVLGGYARLSDADAAMDLFNEFEARGGEPDNRLVDIAATACIRAGQFTRALRLARAMERRGKNVDKARIKRTLETVIRSRERAAKLRAGAASTAAPRNDNLERLKFWLGLPNRYYDGDHPAGGGSTEEDL